MKNSTIAVLIPTKNRSSLLLKSISSVLEQTILPEELIVVNDGSTDDTSLILKNLKEKYNLIKIIERKYSGGVNTARNEGIKSSNSEWVMFLDDDDTLIKTAIENAKNKIETLDKEFAIIFFNTKIINDEQEFIGGYQFNTETDYFDPTYEDFMVKRGLKGDCKPVLKKSVIQQKQYWFPETVNGFESVTLRRIFKDGFKGRYYRDISTVINQSRAFEHLSFSAPAKNPEEYLKLHEEDLIFHYHFYDLHKNVLKNKYKYMYRLAIRSRRYFLAIMYFLKSF